MADPELERAQLALARDLAELEHPPPFTPGPLPRFEAGVLIPSTSVAANGEKIEYVARSSVDRVATAPRAVGAWVRGRWVPLWIGDDQLERGAALVSVLQGLGGRRG